MKFVRYALNNASKITPGVVDLQGNVKDISGWVKDISPGYLMINAKNLSSANIAAFPSAGKADDLYLFPCIPRPGKLICIAFNSKAHTKEMGHELADEPVFFLKATSAISGARDPIIYPKIGTKVDWEAELGVVIGRKGKYISASKAMDHVLGYCCINDVSERCWQFEHPGNQLTKGKSFDSFAPMGPYLVTKDEIINPHGLNVTLKVNDELRQNFSTQDYKYSIQDVISFLSQLFTLEPGDTIAMGSGPGNAGYWGDKYLKIGDRVELEIENLGKQHQIVIEET